MFLDCLYSLYLIGWGWLGGGGGGGAPNLSITGTLYVFFLGWEGVFLGIDKIIPRYKIFPTKNVANGDRIKNFQQEMLEIIPRCNFFLQMGIDQNNSYRKFCK